MSDQRIRHLFDQLVAEPSAEFEASLRARLMNELATSERSRSDDQTQHHQHQEDLIMTVTLDRPDAPAPPEPPRRRLVIALAAAAAVVVLAGAALFITRDSTPDTVVPATTPTTPTASTEAPATTTPATTPPVTSPPATSPPVTAAPVTSPPVDAITAEPIVVPLQAPVAAPTALVAGTSFTDTRIFQIKFDGLNLWGTGEDSTDLFRIDTTTGEIAETLTLPSPATVDWLQADEGLLYVTTRAGVVIVNGATMAISEPRAAGDDGWVAGIAFADDAVWLVRAPFDNAESGTNSLERWDRALLTMTSSVDIGAFVPGGIVAADDSLFLATADRGLLRFDDEGTLTATIDDVGYSYVLGATGDSVWVPDYDSGEVIRIDVATNEIVARISVAGIGAHNIVATDTSVWVTTYAATNINVIDPATNAVTVKTHAAPRPLALALIDGAVWVTGAGEVNSFVPAPG